MNDFAVRLRKIRVLNERIRFEEIVIIFIRKRLLISYLSQHLYMLFRLLLCTYISVIQKKSFCTS